jgi:hypothetical protein
MIKRGVLQSENIAAIHTSTSTVSKGGSLDLALVLLVEQAASVPGNPAGGAGERDVVDEPMWHRTSPEMTTPRDRPEGPCGVRSVGWGRLGVAVAVSDRNHSGWNGCPNVSVTGLPVAESWVRTNRTHTPSLS